MPNLVWHWYHAMTGGGIHSHRESSKKRQPAWHSVHVDAFFSREAEKLRQFFWWVADGWPMGGRWVCLAVPRWSDFPLPDEHRAVIQRGGPGVSSHGCIILEKHDKVSGQWLQWMLVNPWISGLMGIFWGFLASFGINQMKHKAWVKAYKAAAPRIQFLAQSADGKFDSCLHRDQKAVNMISPCILDHGKGVHSLVFKVWIQFSFGHIWL